MGLNPTRDGLIRVLRDMGASIEALNEREVGGEPVADLRVRHSALKGIEVDPAVVPSMVDEFPALSARVARYEALPVLKKYYVPFDAPVTGAAASAKD